MGEEGGHDRFAFFNCKRCDGLFGCDGRQLGLGLGTRLVDDLGSMFGLKGCLLLQVGVVFGVTACLSFRMRLTSFFSSTWILPRARAVAVSARSLSLRSVSARSAANWWRYSAITPLAIKWRILHEGS